MAAELIGGALISGAVQLLLERIASPEVLNFLLGKTDSDFEGLFMRLKRMVSSLTGVLDDAEQRQIRDDSRVEAWLDEVQEAVFDAEDFLGEIEYDALRLKVTGDPGAGTSEVRESKRPKILDVFSFSRYSKARDLENGMKKIVDRLEEIVKQKELLGLRETLAEERLWQRPPSTSLIEESQVFGRDADMEAEIKLLSCDDISGGEKISVIPIVGMGGVGKTTLAQAVFNHSRVMKNFDLKLWVCVSENYDVHRVTSSLLHSTTSSYFPQDADDLNSLQIKLKKVLSEKKFLIVLDDVWNDKYNDWEVLKKPFKEGTLGSKIIVTTRSQEVARITGTSPTYHLDVLTEEASWQLFSKHTLCHDLDTDPDLERIGREILIKCKGLPLAVKTLGGLLRSKSTIDHWEGLLENEIWELTDSQSGILPALRLSYHCLPSHLKRCFAYCAIFPKDYAFQKEELISLWMAENLLEKPKGNRTVEEVGDQYFNHLISMSFFSPSSRYESRYVMHDLIVDLATFVSGKHYFRLGSTNSNDMVMKETRYLACVRSQDIFSERFKSIFNATHLRTFLLFDYRRRDHLCVSKSTEHNLFSKLKYLRVLSLFGHFHEYGDFIDSICEFRHLRFLNLSYASINRLPNSLCELYNLQTLKFAGCPSIYKLPGNIHHLINLRYLDGSSTELGELPESVCLLSNLQKLILRCCSKLTKLPEGFHRLVNLRHLDASSTRLQEMPESLGQMSSLQELILRDCHRLTELPDGFHCLINLRYLDVEGTHLKEMPMQISKLTSLQTLSTFVVGKENGAKIRDLGNLQRLRGTLCIKNIQNVLNLDDAFEAKLRYKKHIRELKFEWDSKRTYCSTQDFELLNNLVPHASLKKLGINGYGGGKFPKWLGHESFCNIVDVHLYKCNFCETLPPLGQLPSLKELRIGGFDTLVNVSPEFCGVCSSEAKPFASLEVLQLYRLPNWENWLIPNREAFQKLKKLHLQNCNNLISELPRFLPSLTDLTISECQNLASSLPMMPKLTKLTLERCSESVVKSVEALESSTSLQNLVITENSHLIRFRYLPTALKTLSISSYKGLEFKLRQRSHDSLEELSLEFLDRFQSLPFAIDLFPGLRTLTMIGSKNLESTWLSSNGLSSLHIAGFSDSTLFSSTLLYRNLTSLEVQDCKELKLFPENTDKIFPVLKSLDIFDCMELESFPSFELPSSLISFKIKNCDKLVASRRNWKLQTLPDLKSFSICGYRKEDMESFPEEGLLPVSVSWLSISYVECLERLSTKELQHLNSLKFLCLSNCRNLRTMTEEAVPSSLENVVIIGCPSISKKFEREIGEHWNKIAHVPNVTVVGKLS